MSQRRTRLWLKPGFSSLSIPQEIRYCARSKGRSEMNKKHLHGAFVFLIRASGGRKPSELRYLKHWFYINGIKIPLDFEVKV